MRMILIQIKFTSLHTDNFVIPSPLKLRYKPIPLKAISSLPPLPSKSGNFEPLLTNTIKQINKPLAVIESGSIPRLETLPQYTGYEIRF